MMLNNLPYVKDAGTTNLLVHVKLSNKTGQSSLFSNVFNNKTLNQQGLLYKVKSLIKVDKFIN